MLSSFSNLITYMFIDDMSRKAIKTTKTKAENILWCF